MPEDPPSAYANLADEAAKWNARRLASKKLATTSASKRKEDTTAADMLRRRIKRVVEKAR